MRTGSNLIREGAVLPLLHLTQYNDRVPRLKDSGAHVKGWLQDRILEHLAYANEHGGDKPEIRDWKWTP